MHRCSNIDTTNYRVYNFRIHVNDDYFVVPRKVRISLLLGKSVNFQGLEGAKLPTDTALLQIISFHFKWHLEEEVDVHNGQCQDKTTILTRIIKTS